MNAWLVPAQTGLALSKRDAGICGPLLPPMLNVHSLHLCKKFIQVNLGWAHTQYIAHMF